MPAQANIHSGLAWHERDWRVEAHRLVEDLIGVRESAYIAGSDRRRPEEIGRLFAEADGNVRAVSRERTCLMSAGFVRR